MHQPQSSISSRWTPLKGKKPAFLTYTQQSLVREFPLDRRLDLCVRLQVDRRRSFVQNDDPAVLYEGAGQGDQGPLSDREILSTILDLGIQVEARGLMLQLLLRADLLWIEVGSTLVCAFDGSECVA